jgi:hypothetical protein
MNKLGRLLAVASLSVLGTLAVTNEAHALEPSTRGPLYFQSSPLGIGFFGVCANAGPFGNVCSVGGTYHVDLEAGYHFMGHHEGFVAGLRQSFYLSGGSAGTTQARLGWDIAIPLKDGQFEITIAPYTTLGVFYPFGGGNAGFAFGIGVEGKFFFYEGLYAFFRPFEGGAVISSSSAFLGNFGAGIGYAL